MFVSNNNINKILCNICSKQDLQHFLFQITRWFGTMFVPKNKKNATWWNDEKSRTTITYVYDREWHMGEIMFLILLLSAPRKPKLWKNREMFFKRHSELKCAFPFEHSSFIKLNAIYLLSQTCIPSLLTLWDWGKVNHNF